MQVKCTDFETEFDWFEMRCENGIITHMSTHSSKMRTVISFLNSAVRSGKEERILGDMRANIPWNMLKPRIEFELESRLFLVDPYIIDLTGRRWPEFTERLFEGNALSRGARREVRSRMTKMMSEVWEQDMSRIEFGRETIERLLKMLEKCGSYDEFAAILPEMCETIKKGGNAARGKFAETYARHMISEIADMSVSVWTGKDDD